MTSQRLGDARVIDVTGVTGVAGITVSEIQESSRKPCRWRRLVPNPKYFYQSKRDIYVVQLLSPN